MVKESGKCYKAENQRIDVLRLSPETPCNLTDRGRRKDMSDPKKIRLTETVRGAG